MVEGGQKINVRLNVGPYLPQMMRDAGFVDVQLEWYIWPTVSTQDKPHRLISTNICMIF